MFISLHEKERNQAHVDYVINLDGVPSGFIRLWTDEEDKFLYFISMWNERQQKGVKRLGTKDL